MKLSADEIDAKCPDCQGHYKPDYRGDYCQTCSGYGHGLSERGTVPLQDVITGLQEQIESLLGRIEKLEGK